MTAFTLLFVGATSVAVTDWRDRVDQLLYAGERVTESVDVGAGRVVVTTHRVLAFTPEGDGANFRTADRPNVEGARVGADGNRRYLRWALGPLLLGALLLAAGSQLSVGDPLSGVDTSGGGTAGTGGIVSTVAGITSLLSLLDELMVAVGAVCLLLAALLVGVYLLGRERLLVVSVEDPDPAGPLDTDPSAPPSDDVATPDGTDAGDGGK